MSTEKAKVTFPSTQEFAVINVYVKEHIIPDVTLEESTSTSVPPERVEVMCISPRKSRKKVL